MATDQINSQPHKMALINSLSSTLRFSNTSIAASSTAPGQQATISDIVYEALTSGGVVIYKSSSTETVAAAAGTQTVALYTGDATCASSNIWAVMLGVLL